MLMNAVNVSLKSNSLKRKGISLLELVIVIAILSITYISIPKFISSFKWYENKINVDYSGNSIMMFINRAKQYCKANKCRGLILVDIVGNKIEFYGVNSSRVELFKPSNKIKITKVSSSSGNPIINIDEEGSTSDASSIYYVDSEGKTRRVSIRVGSEYAHVYE